MRCWRGYLSGARCKWLAYGPADATATPSSLFQKIQNGLSFRYCLPRLSWKNAVKRLCMHVFIHLLYADVASKWPHASSCNQHCTVISDLSFSVIKHLGENPVESSQLRLQINKYRQLRFAISCIGNCWLNAVGWLCRWICVSVWVCLCVCVCLCSASRLDDLLTPAPLSDKSLENHTIFHVPIIVIPGESVSRCSAYTPHHCCWCSQTSSFIDWAYLTSACTENCWRSQLDRPHACNENKCEINVSIYFISDGSHICNEIK